jgi:hypothetical protein
VTFSKGLGLQGDVVSAQGSVESYADLHLPKRLVQSSVIDSVEGHLITMEIPFKARQYGAPLVVITIMSTALSENTMRILTKDLMVLQVETPLDFERMFPLSQYSVADGFADPVLRPLRGQNSSSHLNLCTTTDNH